MGSKKNILVVEDDLEFSNILKETILTHGWNCKVCPEIASALRVLNNQKFDCILLDMTLSNNEKSEDLLDLIKTNKAYQNMKTPVIVVSGTLDKERISKILKSVQGILIKPFKTQSLIDKIISLCGE